eukprot:5132288-Amphidinium_carterae.1
MPVPRQVSVRCNWKRSSSIPLKSLQKVMTEFSPRDGTHNIEGKFNAFVRSLNASAGAGLQEHLLWVASDVRLIVNHLWIMQ